MGKLVLEQKSRDELVLADELRQHLQGVAPHVDVARQFVLHLLVDCRYPERVGAIILVEAAERPQHLHRTDDGHREAITVLDVHLTQFHHETGDRQQRLRFEIAEELFVRHPLCQTLGANVQMFAGVRERQRVEIAKEKTRHVDKPSVLRRL